MVGEISGDSRPQDFQQNSDCESRIPRQFHFIWGMLGDSGEIPAPFERYLKRWRELHNNWDVQVHLADEIRCLAAEFDEYPFQSYGKDIQRVDVCRPMLLHRYGGIYSDLDVEPHISMDEVLRAHPAAGVIVCVENVLSRFAAWWFSKRYRIRKGRPEIRRRIANFWMASVPGHPFWLDVLKLMQHRSALEVCENYDILYTTGPDVITETIEATASRYDDVVVLPQKKQRKAFTHHATSSWRSL